MTTNQNQGNQPRGTSQADTTRQGYKSDVDTKNKNQNDIKKSGSDMSSTSKPRS